MKKQEKMKLYRQGDVLLVQVESIPKDAKPIGHATVALGEQTGHHHTFKRGAEVLELEEMMWVVADEPAPLEHQEHDTIVVDPGTYEVRIQREYAPEAVNRSRRVFD